MADNIKISDLSALTAAQNSTVVPVVDGGTTKKMSLSTLQTHLTASFVTPSNLSSEVSTLNSTINALTTDDIAEGSNEYYTNAKVDARINSVAITSSAEIDLTATTNYVSGIKARLDAEGVISSSQQISQSAAAAGFGTGGGGGASIPSGTVSSSAQITELGFIGSAVTSSMTVLSASYALTASYAVNAGVASGSDYISGISFSGTTLTFTGVGSAFNSTVDLSTGDLLDLTDTVAFLNSSIYYTDSASFASRINSSGGSIPNGTVSSSVQILENLRGTNVVSASAQITDGSGLFSSSAQVTVAQADLTGITSDDIGAGGVNLFYTDARVLDYINSIQVVSGSVLSSTPDGTVSSSAQIVEFGFLQNATYTTDSASFANRINNVGGVNVNSTNIFTAEQRFTDGVKLTGSLSVTTGDIILNGGVFSGSGAQLFGIPATALVGGVELSGSQIVDGDASVIANSVTGVTITSQTSGVQIFGDILARSGSFSGSGALLHSIPGSAIEGGVDGRKIFSSSFSASISDAGEFVVNTNSTFAQNMVVEGTFYSSGSVTAESINVGTSGTPTIFSSTNLNLSASNAVVITDSPFRLTPFTNAQTSSFTFSNGDIVYSSTSNDFYGYKSGSLVSLTAGNTAADVNWGNIIGIPSGLISSSAGFISSSVQIANGAGAGQTLFKNSLGVVTASANFTFTEATDTLTVPSMSVTTLSYTNLSGPAAATGSFNLVDADRVLINNAVELPTTDGSVNQVIKTAGNGTTSFGSVAWGEITSIPDGIISSSVQLPTNLATTNGDNDFDVSQTITGSLFVSESSVSGLLTLYPKDPLPTSPTSGTIAVSGSGAQMKPYFYNGIAWQAMF